MRLGINLILMALIAVMTWLLINSIRLPIEFQAEHSKRNNAVVDKLIQIRTAQECYRGITGTFAPNFDTLNQVLRTGQFKVYSVSGDPDDPNSTGLVYDTSYVSANDSIQKLRINLDSLRYVPFSNKEVFMIQADTMTYQKTLVNVVEVKVQKNKFMGKYADPKYKRYDNSYDPTSFVKFGNMGAPNISGNWER